MEEANGFLPKFIQDYNKRYGRKSRETRDGHRALNRDLNLEKVFAKKSILERPGKPILVESNGKSYAYKEWNKGFNDKPKILDAKEIEAYWPTKPVRKPKRNHPWR